MAEVNRARINVLLRDVAALGQTLADCGIAEFQYDHREIGRLALDVPARMDPGRLLQLLLAHKNVADANFDVGLRVMATSNAPVTDPYAARRGGDLDTVWRYNWAHARLNTYRAWKETKGDRAIHVAFFDTGMRPHEELPPLAPENLRTAQVGSVNGSGVGYATDTGSYGYSGFTSMGHGLMVLGSVFAQHNAYGVAGIAPNCTPVVCRSSDDEGFLWGSLLTDNYLWIAEKAAVLASSGHRVIASNSWEENVDFPEHACRAAMKLAQRRGVVVVAGNGNSDWNNGADLDRGEGFNLVQPPWHYPSSLPGVVAVGGYHAAGRRTQYSNYGTYTHIVAPTNIGTLHVDDQLLPSAAYAPRLVETLTPDGKYFMGGGTSAATPVAAGVIALVWSENPALNPWFPPWEPESTYSVGEHCENGGLAYRCVVGGTTGQEGPSGTVDGEVSWECIGLNDELGQIIYSTASPFLAPVSAAEFSPAPGVINAAKGVLKAKSTLPAKVAQVFPYLGFIGLNYTYGTSGTEELISDGETWVGRPQTVFYEQDASGNITTRLGNADGSAADMWAELTGYANGQEAESVELWVGSELVAACPPQCLKVTAASNGAALPVRVKARAVGVSAEETYSDIAVSALAVTEVESFAVTEIADGMMRGLKTADRTITVDGTATTATAKTWEYPITETSPGESVSFAVSDGSTPLTIEVDGAPPDPLALTATALPAVEGVVRLTGWKIAGSTVSVSRNGGAPQAAGDGPVADSWALDVVAPAPGETATFTVSDSASSAPLTIEVEGALPPVEVPSVSGRGDAAAILATVSDRAPLPSVSGKGNAGTILATGSALALLSPVTGGGEAQPIAARGSSAVALSSVQGSGSAAEVDAFSAPHLVRSPVYGLGYYAGPWSSWAVDPRLAESSGIAVEVPAVSGKGSAASISARGSAAVSLSPVQGYGGAAPIEATGGAKALVPGVSGRGDSSSVSAITGAVVLLPRVSGTGRAAGIDVVTNGTVALLDGVSGSGDAASIGVATGAVVMVPGVSGKGSAAGIAVGIAPGPAPALELSVRRFLSVELERLSPEVSISRAGPHVTLDLRPEE